MSVKAYLVRGDGSEEVRRFAIPEGASTSYNYLYEKIRNIYGLGNEYFKISWQDSDGDHITISSDEELMEAITESLTSQGQNLLRLFITLKKSSDEDDKTVHFGIVCDGCDEQIVGARYKCKTCSDYDLCSSCESKGTHSQHKFVKNPTATSSSSKDGEYGFEFRMKGTPNVFTEDMFGGWVPFRGRRFGRGRGGGGGGCRGWRKWSGMGRCNEDDPRFHSHPHPPPPPPPPHPFGVHHGNGTEGQKPFQWNFSTSGCPAFMGFGTASSSAEAGMPDPQKVAEEASKMASEMASKHVAEVMKGIWSAWSGHCEGAPSCSNATAGDKTTEKASPEKTADANKEKETTPREDRETSPEPPLVDLVMDVDDELPNRRPEAESKESSPSSQSGEEWTLVGKEGTKNDGMTDSPRVEEIYPSIETPAPIPTPRMDSVPPSAPRIDQPQPPAPSHPNERVRNALVQMRDMGYSDEGGWLTRLLEMKDGDINQVLDILLVRRK